MFEQVADDGQAAEHGDLLDVGALLSDDYAADNHGGAVRNEHFGSGFLRVNGWNALDARDGRVLYEFATGGPVAAGISVYAVAGREYIAVPSGSSSRDAASATAAATLIVFSLQ